jgi:raffinose/stachyose/melibiose transport system substrate-binding protein
MYAGSNACYALADAGYLAPMNDLDCLANMNDLSAVTYNGDVVTCTATVAILGTYYNKDILNP